ncbi:hypothetical protein WA158_000704 [Blastocystis sp. Blastoise]
MSRSPAHSILSEMDLEERKSFSFKNIIDYDDNLNSLDSSVKRSMMIRNQMQKRREHQQSRRQTMTLSSLLGEDSDETSSNKKNLVSRLSNMGRISEGDQFQDKCKKVHLDHAIYENNDLLSLETDLDEMDGDENERLIREMNLRKRKTPCYRSKPELSEYSTELSLNLNYSPAEITYSAPLEEEELSEFIKDEEDKTKEILDQRNMFFTCYQQAFNDYIYDQEHPIVERVEPEEEPEEEEPEEELDEENLYGFGYNNYVYEDTAQTVIQAEQCPYCEGYIKQIELLQNELSEKEQQLYEIQKRVSVVPNENNNEDISKYIEDIDNYKEQIKKLQSLNSVYINIEKLVDIWGLKDAIKRGDINYDELQQYIINYSLDNVSCKRLESTIKTRFNMICVNEKDYNNQKPCPLANNKDIDLIMKELQEVLKVTPVTSFDVMINIITDMKKKINQLTKDTDKLTKDLSEEKAACENTNNELDRLLQHYHSGMDDANKEIDKLTNDLEVLNEECDKVSYENDQLKSILNLLLKEHPELEDSFAAIIEEVNYNPN